MKASAFLITKKNKVIQDQINDFKCPGRYSKGIADFPYSVMMGFFAKHLK